MQGCESSSVQLISLFLKIFLCQNFCFFIYFQPVFSIFTQFMLFFLVFCLWPLTPLYMLKNVLNLGSHKAKSKGVEFLWL